MGEKTITKAKVLKFFWVTDSFEKNGLKPWTLFSDKHTDKNFINNSNTKVFPWALD